MLRDRVTGSKLLLMSKHRSNFDKDIELFLKSDFKKQNMKITQHLVLLSS